MSERLGFDYGKLNVIDGTFSDASMVILVGKHGNLVLGVFFARKIMCMPTKLVILA